ncbi:hypothetical protein HaLaN_29748 [Haematococcus lacustris]|uniref:Uncharacterized protein n=1 Tax=Haematococcus lacustris TaxID=44745 RepID=A0A6A0ADS1_HAELA|nr:hypothetical protein HaLaN_29748 [Haematococcus lacustris]
MCIPTKPLRPLRPRTIRIIRVNASSWAAALSAGRVNSKEGPPRNSVWAAFAISEAFPDTPPESFRCLRPVYSKAKRSQVQGLMCSKSNTNIIR